MQDFRKFFVLLILFFVVGCGGEPQTETEVVEEAAVAEAPQWTEVTVDAMDEAQRAQLERGQAAQMAMANGLMGALMAAMDEGGPVAAIQVCHDEASRIAAEQAETSGVKLGRTAVRLRNPENTTPEWASELVAAGTAEPAYLLGPEGQLAALLPILLKPECTMCHGTAEEIDEAVAAKLAEHYPEDQATGFAAGELRGWFWFEVPPEA